VKQYKNGTFLEVKKKRKTLFNDEILLYIETFFLRPTNHLKTLMDLRLSMSAKFGTPLDKIKISTLWRYLKKFNISFKKITLQNERMNDRSRINARKNFAPLFLSLLQQKYYFIFLDETSFHLNSNMRRYGWSKKGKKINWRIGMKSINYSMSAAISWDKILGVKLYKGSMK